MTYEDIEKRFASLSKDDPAYALLEHFVEYHAKYLAGDALRDDIQAADNYRAGRQRL